MIRQQCGIQRRQCPSRGTGGRHQRFCLNDHHPDPGHPLADRRVHPHQHPTYTGSTSPAVSYLVYATATTTTLKAVLNPASQGNPVTRIARVRPPNADENVQFKHGTTAIGAPLQVVGGQATLKTSALPKGTHTLAAEFTPTNPVAFARRYHPPSRSQFGKSCRDLNPMSGWAQPPPRCLLLTVMVQSCPHPVQRCP